MGLFWTEVNLLNTPPAFEGGGDRVTNAWAKSYRAKLCAGGETTTGTYHKPRHWEEPWWLFGRSPDKKSQSTALGTALAGPTSMYDSGSVVAGAAWSRALPRACKARACKGKLSMVFCEPYLCHCRLTSEVRHLLLNFNKSCRVNPSLYGFYQSQDYDNSYFRRQEKPRFDPPPTLGALEQKSWGRTRLVWRHQIACGSLDTWGPPEGHFNNGTPPSS